MRKYARLRLLVKSWNINPDRRASGRTWVRHAEGQMKCFIKVCNKFRTSASLAEAAQHEILEIFMSLPRRLVAQKRHISLDLIHVYLLFFLNSSFIWWYLHSGELSIGYATTPAGCASQKTPVQLPRQVSPGSARRIAPQFAFLPQNFWAADWAAPNRAAGAWRLCCARASISKATRAETKTSRDPLE